MNVSFNRRASWCAWAGLGATLLGCAPAGQPVPKGEVVEVEVIESAPTASGGALPAKTVLDVGAAATKKVDAAKEAADRRINEALRELEPSTAPSAAAAAAAPAVSPASREQVALGDPALTAGVPGSGPITLAQIDQWLADPKNFVELQPILPLGLSQGAAQITGLDTNPLTRAKIELGRQLYFDPRLSADSTVSCASCHNPAEGYTAHTTTGVGIRGQKGGRNSPVSFNRILSGPQFWDGRVDSLEAQAVGPIQNPIEMGFTHEGVVKRLGEIPAYRRQFEKIFGELSIDRVGQAIAAFERVLVTAPSPYDFHEQMRAFAGLDADDIAEDAELAKKFAAAKEAAEKHPLSESAVRGREIFFTEKGNCTACHVGANLADEKYHNIGIGMDKENPDLGRFVVTKDENDRGAFKTPTVRNVALTAPYMHDGSVATLEEVVDWYDKGGHPNPHLSDKIRPLRLSPQDKADLVEFMKACTGPTPIVEVSRLPADAE
jgi:cytochrome c peroxidase